MKNPLTARPKEALNNSEPAEERAPSVRLAVYDGVGVVPKVDELSAKDYREFVDLMANKTYEASHAKGGEIPFTVIREVVENLIHAYFEDCVISITDNGNTIRVADQGPGIEDKEAAFKVGFSTATREMKQFIRGVGSGLVVAKEALAFAGGSITIEDNLRQGAVITLSLQKEAAAVPVEAVAAPAKEASQKIELNDRQKKILFLLTDIGEAGPEKIRRELGISLATAYRDIKILEGFKLIYATKHGRRDLSDDGVDYLEVIGS